MGERGGDPLGIFVKQGVYELASRHHGSGKDGIRRIRIADILNMSAAAD